MKRKKQPLRNKGVIIYFNQEEFDELKMQKEHSTCPNFSLYLRKRLFGQKIVTTYRNLSQDDILEEISKVQKSLQVLAKAERTGFAGEISLEQHINQLKELIKRLLELWLP